MLFFYFRDVVLGEAHSANKDSARIEFYSVKQITKEMQKVTIYYLLAS